MTPTIQLLLQIKEHIDEFFEEASPEVVDRDETILRARECLLEVRRMVGRNANSDIN